jgi:hypothetical protein
MLQLQLLPRRTSLQQEQEGGVEQGSREMQLKIGGHREDETGWKGSDLQQ